MMALVFGVLFKALEGNRNLLAVDEPAVPLVHELQVAPVARGHGGEARGQRFQQVLAPSLTARGQDEGIGRPVEQLHVQVGLGMEPDPGAVLWEVQLAKMAEYFLLDGVVTLPGRGQDLEEEGHVVVAFEGFAIRLHEAVPARSQGPGKHGDDRRPVFLPGFPVRARTAALHPHNPRIRPTRCPDC